MPPHTRSQRRRQTAKQQPPRQRIEHTDTIDDAAIAAGNINQTLSSPAGSIPLPVLQEVPVGTAVRAEAARAPATRRINPVAVPSEPRGANTRRRTRPELAPIDYASDYRSARHDLRWIAIWTVLLFVAMFALHFSGIAL